MIPPPPVVILMQGYDTRKQKNDAAQTSSDEVKNDLWRMCLWWERPEKLIYTERAWNFSSHGVSVCARRCHSLLGASQYCTLTRDSEDATLWIATDACMFNIQQAVVTRFKWAGGSAYSEFSQFVGLVSEQTARHIGGDELQNVDEDVLGDSFEVTLAERFEGTLHGRGIIRPPRAKRASSVIHNSRAMNLISLSISSLTKCE